MKRPRLEVAEVFRSCQDDFFAASSLSAEQRRTFRDIVACRTTALGGHVKRCDACAHEEISYNSCGNRACPKCQAKKQADWLEARAADLLAVPYFHLVFTLPASLRPLALQNQRTLYALLFRAASQALLALARDPKHLGAHIGFVAILHTWGQNLTHHPHLHCLLPGGGLSADRRSWIASRKHFFLPVPVLARLFRGKFLSLLRSARRQGKLSFHGELQPLAQLLHWRHLLRDLHKLDWNVYSKPPFGSPSLVLKYLARYTLRVALSNRRLLWLRQRRVAFSYKDYRRGPQRRTLILDTLEFTRRFLLHVLPKGFVRIRHYGFLAHRSRRQNLACCRPLLRQPEPPPDSTPSCAQPTDAHRTEICPVCRKGHMVLLQSLPRPLRPPQPRMNSPGYDTTRCSSIH